MGKEKNRDKPDRGGKSKKARTSQGHGESESVIESAADDAAAEMDAMDSHGSAAGGSGSGSGRLPAGLLERRLAKTNTEKASLEKQVEQLQNELKAAKETQPPAPAPKVNVLTPFILNLLTLNFCRRQPRSPNRQQRRLSMRACRSNNSQQTDLSVGSPRILRRK